jgi:hypothetical protein
MNAGSRAVRGLRVGRRRHGVSAASPGGGGRSVRLAGRVDHGASSLAVREARAAVRTAPRGLQQARVASVTRQLRRAGARRRSPGDRVGAGRVTGVSSFESGPEVRSAGSIGCGARARLRGTCTSDVLGATGVSADLLAALATDARLRGTCTRDVLGGRWHLLRFGARAFAGGELRVCEAAAGRAAARSRAGRRGRVWSCSARPLSGGACSSRRAWRRWRCCGPCAQVRP